MNMTAIVLEAHGGPEMLRLKEIPVFEPGPGQVLIQTAAAGVNFMDIGVRSGIYGLERPLPFTLGVEGAGRILALREGVDKFRGGERAAWFYVPGSDAELLVASADSLVPIPDAIGDETAAAIVMRSPTASHFVFETCMIKPGDTALVDSAAGGVGLILTKLIKLLGGRVIGRVSTESKAEIARAAGADHVLVTDGESFASDVVRFTSGNGIHVVYDGAGADTFRQSLASLSAHVVLAYYGQTIRRMP
jgi:NADPH2:quinone reductase